MKIFSSPHRSLSWALLGALTLTGACASTDEVKGPRNQVSSLVRYGHFEEARSLALELLAQDPDDLRAQRDLRDTEIAMLLDRGIDQLFQDRVTSALGHFEHALELDPENRFSQGWVEKVNVQIAEGFLTRAAGMSERGQPAEKAAALQQVLAHLPKQSSRSYIQGLRSKAVRGLISVQMFQAYELGGTYSTYQDGLRDLNRSAMVQELGDELSTRIASSLEVQVSGVERRCIQAQRYEQEGLLLAAQFEYGIVLLLSPESERAKTGLDRTGSRLEGEGLGGLQTLSIKPASLEDSKPSMPTDDGPLVRPMVKEFIPVEPAIVEPSSAPEPALPTLGAKLAGLYSSAVDLEVKGLLPEAVEIYDQITRLQPHYEDVAERRETVAEFIIHAENLYTSAMDADEASDALELLIRIAAFWPNYRDVSEQIMSRQAAMAKDGEDSQ